MKEMHRSGPGAAAVALTLTLTLTLTVACTSEPEVDPAVEANKKAYEGASAELKKPVALIAAYVPHLAPPDTKDKYAPKRRPDLDRAAAVAADEIRHAANGARQNLDRSGAAATKDLVAALAAASAACTEAVDPAAVEKCSASVKALDGALQKTEAAAAAAGVTAKYPRVAPDAITDEARQAIMPFLKAKGPGPAETAYWGKRADDKVGVVDLVSACQAAADEVGAISQAFEKAAEPLRLMAVTHKMSLDSQCNGLNATEATRKDLQNCRKKAKSSECALLCGKTKTLVGDGVPAATFSSLEKDYADICSK